MPLLPHHIRRSFSRAAPGYEQTARLQAQVGDLLLERLDLLSAPPARILDVGAGTGRLSGLLKRRYPKAEVLALDLSLGMLRIAKRHGSWWRPLRRIAGDAQALPLADGSVDLLVSNLCLQWVDRLDAAFHEFRRVLGPGGWMLISSFGPDTLTELREAWRAADDAEHVHVFRDMQELGDRVLAQGFANPMFDVERFTLRYPDTRALMHELKAIGAVNALAERRRGLTGKSAFARMQAAYELQRRNGSLPASYEIVFGQAQAPADGVPRRGPRGELASFGVDAMRARLQAARRGPA